MKYFDENECYGQFFLEGTKEFSITVDNVADGYGTSAAILFNATATDAYNNAYTINNGSNSTLTGSVFMKYLVSNPVMLYEVEKRLITNNNAGSLLTPLNILEIDMSGDQEFVSLIPTFNPMQKLTDRLRYNFIDNIGCPLVVDGVTPLLTRVEKGEKIIMTFKYKQIKTKDVMIEQYFKKEYERVKNLVNLNKGLSTFELLKSEQGV